MAFLKSIILLVFFIHWAKAVQFQSDIDAEFNRIFRQIRHSMDNAWKWMREAASKSYSRINEILTARKSYEQGQHKYEDVMIPNDAPIKPKNTPELLTTSPDPQKLLISVNSATSKLLTAPQQINNSINSQESANLPTQSQEFVTPNNQPEIANLQKSKENQPENETINVSQQPTEQTELECENDATTQKSAIATNGQVEVQTQSESQIPLKAEYDANKLELPTVQDISGENSTTIENVSKSDNEMKIVESIKDKEKEPKIVSDLPENMEFEMKRGLSRSIYEQQNIIILFLFFLIIIMSAYFFLLSRTPYTCPSIVIGEMGSKLRPTMHPFQK